MELSEIGLARRDRHQALSCDAIAARMQHGMLALTLPKIAAASARRNDIAIA